MTTVNDLHVLKNADYKFVLSPSTDTRFLFLMLYFSAQAIAAHVSLLTSHLDFSCTHRRWEAQLEVLLFLADRYFWRFGCFFKQHSSGQLQC